MTRPIPAQKSISTVAKNALLEKGSEMTREKETRTRRQAKCASAEKQSQFTTYAAVIVAALAIYVFMTFGLGHLFGVV